VRPNNAGITPLDVAFKMIYSVKLVELLKFLMPHIDFFYKDVEDSALDHLIDIAKYWSQN
jgi:hypothetical protein